MVYLIEITADTNDGDYVTKTTTITPGTKHPPEHYIWFEDIVEVIRDCPEYHNWENEDMMDVIRLYPEIEPERLRKFNEMVPRDAEFGCHTISSIKVYTVINTTRLL